MTSLWMRVGPPFDATTHLVKPGEPSTRGGDRALCGLRLPAGTVLSYVVGLSQQDRKRLQCPECRRLAKAAIEKKENTP